MYYWESVQVGSREEQNKGIEMYPLSLIYSAWPLVFTICVPAVCATSQLNKYISKLLWFDMQSGKDSAFHWGKYKKVNKWYTQ